MIRFLLKKGFVRLPAQPLERASSTVIHIWRSTFVMMLVIYGGTSLLLNLENLFAEFSAKSAELTKR